MVREIRYYETFSKKSPFYEWFDNLDLVSQTTVRLRLLRVKKGNIGRVEPVGSGVLELKFANHSGFRIYFGQVSGIIVILNAGTKGTQKKDIQKAKNYWADFLSRE